jgi:hypothetical protein
MKFQARDVRVPDERRQIVNADISIGFPPATRGTPAIQNLPLCATALQRRAAARSLVFGHSAWFRAPVVLAILRRALRPVFTHTLVAPA